jgi:choline-sulfatase
VKLASDGFRISRREILTGAAAVAAGAVASACARGAPRSAARVGPSSGRRPNILLLWTDQERRFQHWPAGWVGRHLPSQARLARHGLVFDNAFTAAAQCTPSRATFMTSTYPVVSGVTNTLAAPLFPLQSHQLNMARLLGEAGYRVGYKGKWHLSLPVQVGPPGVFSSTDSGWSAADIAEHARAYGAAEWNPPDAGTTEFSLSTLGGGWADNDGRIASGMTRGASRQTPGYGESAREFLESYARSDRAEPFCLFVSFVNPHDVSIFPRLYEQAGYSRDQFEDLGIELPDNFADSLDGKPRIQRIFRDYFARPDQGGPLGSRAERLAYVNFYAYLHKVVDRHVMAILDALDANGLTEDTVILRFSDHGEQGLSHGLRQKMFTAYEETIRVPLVVSNPRLFPQPMRTSSYASLLDLLPTAAGLAGIEPSSLHARGARGLDLAPVIADPTRSVQDSILFTYDDWFGEGFEKVTAGVPTHIRCIREESWMYAVYFTGDGAAFDHELYDLAGDPGETTNLLSGPPSVSVAKETRRLHARLTSKLELGDALPGGFDWARAVPQAIA